LPPPPDRGSDGLAARRRGAPAPARGCARIRARRTSLTNQLSGIRPAATPRLGARLASREIHRVRARARCTRRPMVTSATGQEAASVVAPYEAVSSMDEIEAA